MQRSYLLVMQGSHLVMQRSHLLVISCDAEELERRYTVKTVVG